MLKRQTEGSVICTSCGVLVGVNDATCYNCGRWNPGLWGYGPALRRLGHDLGFVPLVVGSTLTLYALSLLLSRDEIGALLSPSFRILVLLGAAGSLPVFELGHWWTVITAGWLHAGILHVFFNVLWIRQLAPAVADLYGPGRMVILYIMSSIIGFTVSSTAGLLVPGLPLIPGARLSVGASAPIFGLLGALVHHGRRTGSSHTAQAGLQYALFMGVFGLVVSGVDNWAHAGGFAGGYLTSMFLDPLKPERLDHLAIAVGLLVITLIAIIASFVTVMPLLMA